MQCSFERVLRARCEADAELFHGRSGEPAPLGVVERLAAIAGGDLRFEISASRLERIEQAQALFRHALELRVWLRHLEAGVAGEPLHGFREAQALGLHDEAENVAVLA